ncbi:hypothetical protein HDU76_001392 [Blyttiomyces sp. JEL0837]|nr:hypothetical protein HDU76_001392 [Blyttiomyces sp. JEL0837]
MAKLKRNLYHLFSQHGKVIDVVVMKRESLRGQAFIVYRETAEATAALRLLQGFPFFGKSIKLSYATGKSQAVMLLEGRVAPLEKGPKGQKAAGSAPVTGQKRKAEDDEPVPQKKVHAEEEEEEEDDEDMDEGDDDEEEERPNKILFLSELPSEATNGPEALTALFKQYKGFKEVRLVPGKSDLAFVEYEHPDQAVEARKRLNGFLIDRGSPLKIHFAKLF